MIDIQPGAFFGQGRKSGGQGGKPKSTKHAPVEPAKEPVQSVEGEIRSDDSVQILKSPPAIPRMVYDNMPNCVGSKPNLDKSLGRFIPSPTSTFLNKEAQVKFDNLRSEQEMSPNTLVRSGVETRRSPRLTLVTESQKAKLAGEIAHQTNGSNGSTSGVLK